MVNRLWHYHFGRGIVATPSDFGHTGAAPTHPELLEWLAGELVRNGWRLKPLHRLIMTSAVYVQSGALDQQRYQVDPQNQLWWRYAPRRLEAEPIRDALLAVSGRLDRSMYGPGSLDVSNPRRSVYLFIKRSKLVPMMVLFDWPEHLVGIGRRSRTTVAPQALLLMNHPLVRRCAEGLAGRIAQVKDPIDRAYRLCFARPVESHERARAERFLREQAERYRAEGAGEPERMALVDFCHGLLASNEFLYID